MDSLQQRLQRSNTSQTDLLEDFFLIPRSFYFKEEFDDLSTILTANHLNEYAKHPRLYFILRESGKLNLFTHFTAQQVGDSSFPLPARELNAILIGAVDAREDQLEVIRNTILKHQDRAVEHKRAIYQRALDKYFDEIGGLAPSLDDSNFEEIARLLQFCEISVEQATASPKLYYVLRSIGLEGLFDTFRRHGYSDFWIPFRRGDIKSHILPHDSSLDRILQAQKLVYNSDWSENIHLNFADEPKALRSLKELGSGGVGTVDHVFCRSHHRHYARKSIYRSPETLRIFSNELKILKSISHKHCVTLAASYTDVSTLALLYVPVADMDLATMIGATSGPLATDRRHFLQASFGCLTVAIQYLHGKGILHKDIKPQNILIHSNRLLVTDFGLSAEAISNSTTLGYTVKYDAPEVAEGGRHKESSDIWSLGCVFLEMLAKAMYLEPEDFLEHWKTHGLRRVVYNTNNEATQSFIIKHLNNNDDKTSLEPMAKIARTLVREMLNPSATDRPSASQMVSSLAQGYDESGKYGRCCREEYVACIPPAEKPLQEQQQQEQQQRELPDPGSVSPAQGIAHQEEPENLTSMSDTIRSDLWGLGAEAIYQRLGSHPHKISALAFSSDRKMIVSGSWDHTVKLWNVTKGKLHKTLEGHQDKIVTVTFSPDDSLVASGSHDETIKIWNTATGELHRTLKDRSSVKVIVLFSPDGKFVVSGSSDYTIKLWNTATGELYKTLQHRHPDLILSWISCVVGVAISPDGKLVASRDHDNTVSLWNTATGELHKTYIGSFAPSKGRLTSTPPFSPASRLYNTLQGNYSATRGYTLVFSPNSQLLASGSVGKKVDVLDTVTGKLHQEIFGVTFDVSPVFSPDGRLIATSTKNDVQLWDTATGELHRTLENERTRESMFWIEVVAFSPDNKFVYSASRDGGLTWWDLATGLLLGLIQSSLVGLVTGQMSDIVFSPDGKLVVAAYIGSDKSILYRRASTSSAPVGSGVECRIYCLFRKLVKKPVT